MKWNVVQRDEAEKRESAESQRKSPELRPGRTGTLRLLLPVPVLWLRFVCAGLRAAGLSRAATSRSWSRTDLKVARAGRRVEMWIRLHEQAAEGAGPGSPAWGGSRGLVHRGDWGGKLMSLRHRGAPSKSFCPGRKGLEAEPSV